MMYWQKEQSHDDKAKVFAWAGFAGAFMTILAWMMIIISADWDILLVPTTFTILSLSILLSRGQYDEFHRAMAYAGAVGGMLTVTFWTAIVPILGDMFGADNPTIAKATAEPRFTFFIAATGFFIGFYWKRVRG